MAIFNTVYGGEGWIPNANTIAYYPLTSNTTIYEQSGKNKDLTNSGVTFGMYQGVDCAFFDGSHNLTNTTSYGLNGPFTASIRVYYVYKSGTWEQPRFYGDDNGNIGLWVKPDDRTVGYNPKGSQTTQTLTSDSGWALLTVTYDGNNCNLYYNGTKVDTTSKSGYTYTDSKLGIGGYIPSPGYWKGGLSEFILENRAWSDAEITSYYNQKKVKYGL